MYKELSNKAIKAEKCYDYKLAGVLWLQAEQVAKKEVNRDYCINRYEFCRAALKRQQYR